MDTCRDLDRKKAKTRMARIKSFICFSDGANQQFGVAVSPKINAINTRCF